MQGIAEALTESVKDPTAARFLDLYYAKIYGHVKRVELEMVAMMIGRDYRELGEYNANQPYKPLPLCNTKAEKKASLKAQYENYDQRKWHEKMDAFSVANDRSMSERESQWLMYIKDGVVMGDVAEVLKSLEAVRQVEKEGIR